MFKETSFIDPRSGTGHRGSAGQMANRLIRKDPESQTGSQELLFDKIPKGHKGTVAHLSQPDKVKILYYKAPSEEAKKVTQKEGTNRKKQENT